MHSQPTRCVIVDDEPYALELLEDYIERIQSLLLIEKFDDPLKAFHFLQEHEVDLLFLDIEMPGLNGMQLMTTLADHSTQVIFTTAYSEYAAESYDKNALDYLLKPISFERFLIAINKYQAIGQKVHFKQTEQSFYIKTNGGFRKLAYKSIGYIKSVKDYVMVYTATERFMVYHSLKKLEQVLPDDFKRVHHSYMVSLSNIEQVKHHHCHIFGEKIPISKKYRPFIYDEIGRKLL